MPKTHDIFLRAHTVVVEPRPAPRKQPRARRDHKSRTKRWPKYALVFDCETRIDNEQKLTFGFYRVLQLKNDDYVLDEEGAFFDDDLQVHERKVLEDYARNTDTEIRTFPPRFPLYPRSEFVKKIFYRYARKGALIVGFNICFDLSRLACKWLEGEKNEWALVLVKYPDGNENLHFPRIFIEPIDSKKSFISFRGEWVSKKAKTKHTKIGDSRFLDLRTLLWSLFNLPLSLKSACKLKGFRKYNLPKKIDHKPTGKVTKAEIRYARQDVRCTAALLNAAKKEFDLHPISLTPDRAYSAASIAKSYLEAMNITRPEQKFGVSPRILGIAMESYMGGRSETRVRLAEVPVVPVDFTSEYPSTCVLLKLWEVVTAEYVTFDDVTADVRELLQQISHADCFRPDWWPDFRFFALVKPNKDILPVRTLYNGKTPNIANNYFTSSKPIWIAGPDLIASKIQTGRAPEVIQAIGVNPHGKQPGMKSLSLRGMVEIDPYKDDLFKQTIEQRKIHKSDKELYYWLKIFANSIYGFFVEINPESLPVRRSVKLEVYSGEDSFVPEKRFLVKENQGHWYAPYLASLITSGGRLLLALLEKSVNKTGGTHAWADTDALAIVSSRDGGALRGVPGFTNIRALSWKKVEDIVSQFESLNPYDRRAVPGSILNLVDPNYVGSDPRQPRRQLLGFSIAAKRYALYERSAKNITIVDPKAHGLGYLYPPVDSPKGWEDEHNAPRWIYEFWECLLRIALDLNPRNPAWMNRPQMMRMSVTTNNVLKRLHGWGGFRPYNFFLLPILATGGYPAGIDPEHFTLVAPFESDQRKWTQLKCTNIGDHNDHGKYQITTSFKLPDYGKRAVAEIFEDLLYRYKQHPEAKSLGPDGRPCSSETRGLLRRAHIIAGKHRRIGKESDRRWEEGDELEVLSYQPMEFDPPGTKRRIDGLERASESFIRKIKKSGIRPLVRFGLGRRILEKICRRESVGVATLRKYEYVLRQYETMKPMRKTAGEIASHK